MRSRSLLCLAAFTFGLSLAACTDDGASEAGSESEGEVERACPCIPISDEETRMGTEAALPDCGDEQLCPTIVATLGIDEDVVIEDPAALDCALEALRDRTPGLLRWEKQNISGDDAGYVLIQDDGTLILRNWGLQDLAWVVSESELGPPLPSDDFEGCLADPDLSARLNCVRSPLDSTTLVCDERWGIDVI